MYEKKKIQRLLAIVFAVLGLVLVAAGIIFLIIFEEPQGIMKTLPYICVGVGAGSFGGSIGGIISYHKMQKEPKLAKQVEIDTRDERNIFITYKAKAMTYNFTFYIFTALIMFLALVQVEVYITLVFAAAYLLVIFLYIYFLNKYQKEL